MVNSLPMSITIKTALSLGAIALGITTANYSLPLNAQTDSSEEFSFEDIQAGKDGSWNFSSEDETISIQDNLRQLNQEVKAKEYDISYPYDSDLRLIEEERRWDNTNTGNRPDYILETDIYDY